MHGTPFKSPKERLSFSFDKNKFLAGQVNTEYRDSIASLVFKNLK